MNDVDEIILDFDGNVDFSLSEDPQPTNSNLAEGDSLFSLESDMNYATTEQLTEEKFSTEGKNEDSELTDNQLSENIDVDNNSTLSQQKDQDELKFDDFDLDLNDYSGNVDDVPIEDDEFWKELGLDPPNESEKEEKFDEKSETPNNFDTDNTNINPKENTPKRLISSQSDDIKINNISSNKSVKRTSKSPEKEDGEIFNASTSADRQVQQSQKQKLSQSQQQVQTQRQAQTQRTQTQRQQQQNNLQQQQNLQNYRGRGGRRNNDWRPINNNNTFLNSGMSSFRPGFGPGLEGMPGMQMGQMPLNNPHMLPIPHGMIGPNIHVNPNFARLRPHTLFGNPMSQYPIGSGGPPMNMMPYQGQMDMHPYHPSITPMGSGRGNNNSYGGRGGSPGFNHNSISPRRPANQQNNNQSQRPMQPSPKRKVPNDGFEQKEPDSKKISVTNGKSPVPDAKSVSALQKNVEKSKAVASPATKNSTSPAVKASNSKQGISTANTNKTSSAATKNKIAPASSNATSSTSVKQTPKPVQKSTPKNTARNAPAKADAASTPTSKSTTKTDSAPSSGGNKLTIRNVVKNVTRRDIQELANKVPIGFSAITFDRSAQTAEVEFETPEGAKMFRRMHNRSLLHGSNIVINFS
ncbi:unnamed protein product [Rhizophagus irregularis]|uniref:RRM domain-containing protein n=1 Tax=Rhizophagus irregularis TaxID=588596 RepID=A0A2N1N8V1_9GLOM|nr:hypothetical protein RhiirC2_746677 [Rhizophagus irregularis]CAB4382482.1 unnamed protein product [Rhizophagus irregularis]CAB5377270.1 unnamed protein product [Rhizophagus irregularis]